MSGLVAIDFGTSRTKLAYAQTAGGRPELLRFNWDRPYTPSLFYFPAGDSPVQFGDPAEAALERDPAGVIALVKRRLREPRIRVRNRTATPGELMALMLMTLRSKAGQKVAAFNGQLPDAVVLTVPAGLDAWSIDLLETAARSVGFTQVEVMPEPVAAARGWLVEADGTADRLVVLDCGGGTVDWAYLEHKGGRFRVVPSCPPGGIGDRGGHDVDLGLLDLLRRKIATLGKEIQSTRVLGVLAELRDLKERVTQCEVPVAIGIDDVSLSLTTREILDVIETHFVTATIEALRPYLEKVKAESADQPLPPVLLAGGSARLPGLREAIEKSGYKVVGWDRADYAPVLGALAGTSHWLDHHSSEDRTLRDAPERQHVLREVISGLGQLAAVANRNNLREIERDILAEVSSLAEARFEA